MAYWLGFVGITRYPLIRRTVSDASTIKSSQFEDKYRLAPAFLCLNPSLPYDVMKLIVVIFLLTAITTYLCDLTDSCGDGPLSTTVLSRLYLS